MIIIPVPTPITEEPKCPHCKQELDGWSEPPDEDCSGKSLLIVLSSFLVILTLGIGILIGAVDGSMETKCGGKYFSKRWHYLVPTYQVSCHTTVWLRNAEHVNDSY